MKVREGSITVSYRPFKVNVSGKRYAHFRLRFWQDGKLHTPIRKTEDEARRFAEQKALELANGQTAASRLSIEDAASIARIKQLLAQHGLEQPCELFVAESAAAIVKLKGKPLTAAIEFYLKHHPESGQKMFTDLVTAFLAFKERDGTRAEYRKELNQRLNFLARYLQCPLESLTAADLTKVLDDLQTEFKWSNRNRNHYRAALSNLANWARDEKQIARTWQELDFVRKLKERDGSIIIWTPEEAAHLFAVAEKKKPALVPTLILMFFIGHRSSETTGSEADNVRPIDWRDLNLETGEGYLEEGKVRSAGNRITYIPPNARAWLKRYQQKSGPLCPFKNLDNQLARLAVAAKLPWKQNAARRSYISYRLAETRNLPCVSEETGTSITTLQKRYRKPRPLTEAQKYFNIMPVERGRKVLKFPVKRKKSAKSVKPSSKIAPQKLQKR